MFCSKCGKEINDEALICPACGCATMNFHTAQAAQPQQNVYSSNYLPIHEFAVQAANIRNLGIAAAILMFGIGIIFSIIIFIKAPKIAVPEAANANPNELAELEDAKRKLNLGQRLAALPIIGIGLCLFVGSMAIVLNI